MFGTLTQVLHMYTANGANCVHRQVGFRWSANTDAPALRRRRVFGEKLFSLVPLTPARHPLNWLQPTLICTTRADQALESEGGRGGSHIPVRTASNIAADPGGSWGHDLLDPSLRPTN
ncbi:hypothetical protein EVAR_102809_1 [Eumeta japonica]|uniref:Uncharacterized protein n=1 Tax=Eumeta variegata TaxID=151549 RepID=A0A4C1TI24_EUMVA|nr:hypothetical protein EVAR_102809_1 [Eumeta japonica]